jgi:hypothetical protein
LVIPFENSRGKSKIEISLGKTNEKNKVLKMSQIFQKLSICRSIDIKRCLKESFNERETCK